MLSAVIITKNEENTITQCMNSLAFCDEILVIDDFSVDRTTAIASKLGANVIKKKMEDFSQQRNYAFEKTLGDWIFFVDADEVVSTELAKEITEIITKNKVFDGFSLKRDDIFLGKTLRFGETAHINFCRLVKKGKGVWQGLVHERLEVRGKTGVLKNRLLHYSHANLTEFLEKINSYSTYRAMELKAKGEKTSFFDILWHFNAKFILNYFIRFGFLDGFLGLVMALMMSFHSFLVRSKLYLLTRNK